MHETGQLHLRWTTVKDEIDGALEARLLSLLSTDEQQRYARFRYDRDRRLFLVAHALLRTTLSEFGCLQPEAWRFRTNEHGKPFLDPEEGDPPLRFNLTHAAGLAACVVCRGTEVGVDTEHLGRVTDPGLAGRFFAPSEQAQLVGLDGEDHRRAFFDIWTLKESYVKARGIGVSLPLRSFAFTLPADDRDPIGFSPPPDDPDDGWRFFRFRPTTGHTLAVTAGRLAEGVPEIATAREVPLTCLA